MATPDPTRSTPGYAPITLIRMGRATEEARDPREQHRSVGEGERHVVDESRTPEMDAADDASAMAAIADRAGVTRRTLYLHFSSRADLFLALHAHVDERLDLAASVRRVRDAPDAVTALSAFAGHLAGFHPKILPIDLALTRAATTDPDVAALVDQGARVLLEECRRVARRLEDEGRLALPWSVDTAADLMWNFMFADGLQRFTVDRGWSTDQYRELLTVLLHRTLVSD
ncbi:MAG: TetR/AcrR family transcriptional regulator [Dermatophilaceae bacterium]|nr:TetR/AcrR family transcriptional regulator [Intrasporangiaceae bacterium]